MSTYEIGSGQGNDQPLDPNNNNQRNNFENNISDNSKDQKISQLKAKILDLKQHQKDYDSLNQRYKQLLNDFSLLNEAKLRLEYEIRQRESEYNRRISDIKGENEILHLGLNDKMTNSKKLFCENDILEREIGLKDGEINDLNGRLSDISNQLDRNQETRDELCKIIRNLNDNNANQNEQICKLKQDNICLTNICQDNEKNLKMGEDEVKKMIQKNEENNYELDCLNKKVTCQENNLRNLQNKLNCFNEVNFKLQNNAKNCERQFDLLRNENDGLKNNLLNERTIRCEKGNQNEKLKNILMDKERELNQLCNDNDKIQIMNRNDTDKNRCYKIENDKLRNLARILECQNQNIINEIDNILNEDRKMKEILSRKCRITSLLRDNNDTLERSVNNLDSYISSTACNDYNNRANSTRLTYQFADRNYL